MTNGEWTPVLRYNALGWDPAQDAFRYDPNADISGNGQVYTMTPEFQQFVQQGGWQPKTWTGPDGYPMWGIADAQGNILPETVASGFDDRGFWNAALLAGAVTGANMGAAGFGANGLEAGAASGGGEAGAGAFMEANAGNMAPVGNSGGLEAWQAAQGGAGAGSSPFLDANAPAGNSSGLGQYTSQQPLQTTGQYPEPSTFNAPSGPSSTPIRTAGNGNMGTSLADFFSGNGSASDYGRAAQTLYGLYAQNRATDAAREGQAASNALMREMWQASQAENKPLVDMRNSVLPKINALLSNPSSVTQDPGYQFGLQQGQNQIDNSMAARGGYYSGAQMKASQKFGQDYAGTKLNDSLNRLMGVAGMGQLASSQNQQANNALAGGLGRGLAEMGNIRGSGYLGQAGTVNNAMNNWFADQWFRQGGGG